MFERRPMRRERFSHYRVCADFFRTENEHMFAKKGVRKITPDERKFALCFARTLSVKRSCAAAGFEGRTSFARASRLLERDDVHAFVRAEILRENAATAPCGIPEAPDGAAVPLSLDPVRETHCDSVSDSLHPEHSDDTVTASRALCAHSFVLSDSENAAAPGAKEDTVPSYERIEERILREYERIAFADTESGEVKIADKLRALEQYRAIAAARRSRDDGALSLTVNYDYGDADG